MPTPIPHQWAEVIHGIAEGKTAQRRVNSDESWFDETRLCYHNPLTHPHWEWRLKPEPKVVKVRIYRSGLHGCICTVFVDFFTTAITEDKWAALHGHEWLSPWTDIEITE